jgi:SAM-dependent methyltransferase
MTSHVLNRCLCCNSSNLRPILDLGVQPPANSYAPTADEHIETFPLGLNVCAACWHAQLTYCVDRHQIFDRYAYVSGTSSTLNRFFSWFADALAHALKPGARVLELAANDGSLIREMQRAGLSCVGVDPAANIVEKAQEAGLPIVCGYWPQASQHVEGLFDAMVCMNVVAHVDDPLAFLVGCKQKLARGGVVLVQPSQARMFENSEFDTTYHEHISFFNTSSMGKLAERAGLKLVDAFMVKIHGDSPVYVLQHADETHTPDVRAAFASGDFAINEDLYAYEERVELYNWGTYDRFGVNASRIIGSVVSTVKEYEQRGFDVVFVGAAAKAMTVINAAGIKPAHFLDENPMKIGLYAPGCGALIEPLEAVTTFKKPTLFILSAWNFRHELAAKLRERGVPEGSLFYSYFPTPAMV